MSEEAACAVFIKVHSRHSRKGTFLLHVFVQSLVNITYTGHCVVFVSEEVVCLHQMGPVGTFSGLR